MVLALYGALFFGLGCSTDCIYDFFEDKNGDEQCGRFCPLKDEEGNDVLDSKGEIKYDTPEAVARVNCELPGTTRTTTTATVTPTATATVSPSSSG